MFPINYKFKRVHRKPNKKIQFRKLICPTPILAKSWEMEKAIEDKPTDPTSSENDDEVGPTVEGINDESKLDADLKTKLGLAPKISKTWTCNR